MPHPDELLAAYVDGSASPDEARSVESHLATCSECRNDVGFAMVGRAALAGLPELEEPGIARADLPGMMREDDKRIQPPTSLEERRERGRLWEQVAWAAAVAAVVAGIIGAVVFISKGNTTRSATAPVKAPAESGIAPTSLTPSVVNNGVDYSQDSLSALARRLAAVSQNPVPAPSAYVPDRSSSLSKGSAAQLEPAATITACLRAGSGLGEDAVPTYLELATYQSTPAYVGVFPSDAGGPHLLLIVVSVNGCQPLFVVSQSQ